MRLAEFLNHLGTQAWAAFLVVAGMGLLVYCLSHGYAAEIPAGVIGAGLALFQGALKSQTTVNAPNATTQQVATGETQPPARA